MVGHRRSQNWSGNQPSPTRFECVHVMVDDYSRLAYAEVLPTLRATCAISFLRRAVTWFAQHGVQVKAVMTDNGSAYYSHAHQRALTELGFTIANNNRFEAQRLARAIHNRLPDDPDLAAFARQYPYIAVATGEAPRPRGWRRRP